MHQEVLITKKSGEQEYFNEEKLRNSLKHSGADEKSIEEVITQLLKMLHSGMSTRKVYSKAYSILSKMSFRSAGKYRLKKAIMELGPTGFPFEMYIGAILEHQQFEVATGQIISGQCVQHEVDVVATNNEKVIMVECKFHLDSNRKNDVKIPLYVKSRFDDIRQQWEKEGKIGHRTFEGWLVTNTRFSEDAEKFGYCAGLKLVAWDYPKVGSLRQLVDNSGLHPITSLRSLNQSEKTKLLAQGIILCRQISEIVLTKNGIAPSKIAKICEEALSLSH
jgi:hypothetical protein